MHAGGIYSSAKRRGGFLWCNGVAVSVSVWWCGGVPRGSGDVLQSTPKEPLCVISGAHEVTTAKLSSPPRLNEELFVLCPFLSCAALWFTFSVLDLAVGLWAPLSSGCMTAGDATLLQGCFHATGS